MTFEEIKNQIETYKAAGKSLFTSSSFQSHSLVLLHILSRIDKTIPVYFVNTGYHFPETIVFKERVTELLGINTIDIFSQTPKYLQKGPDGRLFFTSDPDFCCFLNKTQPLEGILKQKDIWINGVRADQSAVRQAMKVEQPAPFNVTRFHPMLDWTPKMIHNYIKEYDLPTHPLEEKGYLSIGCEPCTSKFDPSRSERDSRWFGLNKTECGLNTDLIN